MQKSWRREADEGSHIHFLPDCAEDGLLESFATASQIDCSFTPVHPYGPGDYVTEDLVDIENFVVHMWSGLTIRVFGASRPVVRRASLGALGSQGMSLGSWEDTSMHCELTPIVWMRYYIV